MKPINDFLVIKVLKVSHESGGLELYSENNKIRYNYGEVVDASTNTVLKAGDKVYYDAIAGSELRHDGERFLVLKERDIALIDE